MSGEDMGNDVGFEIDEDSLQGPARALARRSALWLRVC
jgi:hypothetical protein